MILKKLCLRNFRNFKNEVISFCSRMNIICGGNAEGKTNLLEAIYLLSTGRSFRSNNLSDLIKDDASYFYLEAIIEKDNVEQKLSIYFDKNEKKIFLNNTRYSSLANLFGLLPSVLFSPEDIFLISGSPNQRRKFLNLHIAQHDPLYIHHLSRFWKAMKQRNYLLKNKTNISIEIWEKEISKAGSYITIKRNEAIKQLLPSLSHHMNKFSLEEEVTIQYSSFTIKNDVNAIQKDYLSLLEKNRPKEQLLGYTTTGPHRDDFSIWINNKNSKYFSSEGQKQTFIASLRLAEWDRLSALTEDNVLINIDDIGIHLDKERKHRLEQFLSTAKTQIFITTPNANLQMTYPDNSCLLPIKNGSLA